MKKLFLIAFKDLRLMFRDRAALVFMLLAPFLLTIGMGFVTGRFSGSSSGLSDIPVVIVNLDQEQLGGALADVFSSEELADLMEPTTSSDAEAARHSVDDDGAAAAVIIPQGFTRSIIPAAGTAFDRGFVQPDTVKIEVYANPSRPTSSGVVKAIVDEFVSRVEEGRTSGMTSILQLMQAGLLDPQNAESEINALFQGVIKHKRARLRSRPTRKARRQLSSTSWHTWRREWHCCS
jgi:ABC-2 type transport system permease protein